jgi:lipopolysaccharide transport system ATP-binding protein
MSTFAIAAEHISKEYHIGALQLKSLTLRDTLTDAFRAPLRRAGRLLRGHAAAAADLDVAIWALRDVSFQIRPGEAVGIIGRNGAGKSTLLKVLSRITEPSGGYVDLNGRVGSLLEVGTGFHEELTGRENIYLNGAILGMKRAEIARKFDEIVAFSEVEKFIDTPVKHYSSGMYLRLAFAVAAHLEPEILIVDEVLAVGDARFQKKCLNKMQDVGQTGRTVLFVSHNMAAITRLCERAIMLDEGRVVADGPTHEVVADYLNAGLGTSAAREWPDPATAPGGEVARLRGVAVRAQTGKIIDTVDIRRPVAVEMQFEVLKPGYVLLPHFHFHNEADEHVFVAVDQDPDWRRRPRPKGCYTSTAWIPGNLLSEGTLYVEAALATLDPNIQQFGEDAVAFHVVDSLDGDSARGDWAGRLPGAVRPLLKWETQFSPNGH